MTMTDYSYLQKATPRQIDLLASHLLRRYREKEQKSGLSIVYDITYICNQACPGCCVSAIAYKKGTEIAPESHGHDFQGISKVLHKIRAYLDSRPELPFFLDFGGGELTLRPDWKDIVRLASELFGRESVGMNTNGTRASVEDLLEIEPYISYIGISIDGLEEYHNRWRKTVEGVNSYQKTMTLISQMLEHPSLRDKLDITTVPTKDNLAQIPDLMQELHALGIRHYSVHRAMQVGRFWERDELLPGKEDYFDLLLRLIETGEELGMNVHLHHSIESIYTALLLGHNTYAGDNIGNPDRKASLGIDPWGRVFFDPWCTVAPWDKLASSSLLDDGMDFEDILRSHGGVQDLIDSYCRIETRCQGCPVACSGGNRIASAAQHIRSTRGLKASAVSRDDLLGALAAVDPACPLYRDGDTFAPHDDADLLDVLRPFREAAKGAIQK